VSSSDLKSLDFTGWAQESFDIATETVYPDFVEGQDPDQAYMDAAKPIID